MTAYPIQNFVPGITGQFQIKQNERWQRVRSAVVILAFAKKVLNSTFAIVDDVYWIVDTEALEGPLNQENIVLVILDYEYAFHVYAEVGPAGSNDGSVTPAASEHNQAVQSRASSHFEAWRCNRADTAHALSDANQYFACGTCDEYAQKCLE